MSKVQLNNGNFEEVQTHINLAKDQITEAMDDVWSKNFTNLYNNFVTNGFLKDLYEDAESIIRGVFGLGTTVVGVGGAYIAGSAAASAATAVTAASVSACIPVIGWIIAAIILAILAIVGIYYMIQQASDVKYNYEARDALINLLDECDGAMQPNYLAMENMETKFENAKLALQNILFKIDEFNTTYASLEAAAKAKGVDIKTASDSDPTILGINTTVTIDGQTIETTTSEALNAFYTYNETVMNAEIQADYLSRTYGFDINYTDIVKKANTFMTNTMKSGLYSHEFIEGYLIPTYGGKTMDPDGAKKVAMAATGLSMDQVNAALNNTSGLIGTGALAAGLLGMPLLGTLVKATTDPGGTTPTGTTPSQTNPTGTTPTGTTPTGSNPTGSNPTGSNPTGSNPSGDTDKDKDTDKDTDKDKDKDKDKDPVNKVKIPELVENKLPEKVEPVYKVDYDTLAREQYEFEQDFDKIMEERANLITEIESKYDNGDLDSLRNQLKEYGYNSAEAEAILASKFLTSKAILEGAQRAELAERAEALAKAAGEENFKSKYSERPNYDKLTEEEASEELMLSSGDKKVTDAYDKMKEARDDYTGKVKDANDALIDVNENKKAVEEIKAKYVEKYGEDTSQWSEEAANEYKEAIDKYNTSVEDANKKIEEANKAEKAYETANSELEKAKEDFYKNGSSDNGNNNGNDGGKPVDNPTQGSTGENGGKPNFAEPTDYNTDGVTVDGAPAGSAGTYDTNVFGTDNSLNMDAALAMSIEQQILSSLEEKDGELIQH